jgi:phosphoglycolate phosphatase
MHTYNLIIFDWDGTLMDSKSRIVSCIQAACRDVGIEAPSTEHTRDVIGLGLHEACRQLLSHLDEEVRVLVQKRYCHHFLSNDIAPAQLFRGVKMMLQDLHSRGYLLAIATGMSRDGLNKILQETSLVTYFHATRSVDESACKPDPLMLHQLLDYFDLDAKQAVMVGDTEYDLKMARCAGMDALAVSYGAHEEHRLLPHHPLACIDSISQMHNWLTGDSGKNY